MRLYDFIVNDNVAEFKKYIISPEDLDDKTLSYGDVVDAALNVRSIKILWYLKSIGTKFNASKVGNHFDNACFGSHLGMMKFLILKEYRQIDLPGNLHYAVEGGRHEVAKLLLKHLSQQSLDSQIIQSCLKNSLQTVETRMIHLLLPYCNKAVSDPDLRYFLKTRHQQINIDFSKLSKLLGAQEAIVAMVTERQKLPSPTI